jgi:hypothetical protein
MTKQEAKQIAMEGIANSSIDRIFDVIDMQMPVDYTDRDLDKVVVALKAIIQKWIEKNKRESGSL